MGTASLSFYSYDTQYFISFISVIIGAVELHRGYDKEAVAEDKQSDINHIVFLVHGMGQLYHGEGGIVQSRRK